MHPVERMGDVDDPLLLPDRRDRIPERHPSRDLLVQEQPDHLALVARSSPLRRGSRSGRARGRARPWPVRPPKTLWSVTAIAPRPSASACSSSPLRLDRAVVRPARVHVQIGHDPVAVGKWVGGAGGGLAPRPPPPRRGRVDLLELVGDLLERRRLGAPAGLVAEPRPERRRLRRSEPPLPPRARVASTRPGGSAMAHPAASASRRSRSLPPSAGTKIAAFVSRSRRTSGLATERVWARSRSPSGIDGRRVSGALRASTSSQSGRERSPRSTALAVAGWPGASSATISRRFSAGANRSVSTPTEIERVVAREALRGDVDRLLGRCEQRIDAGEQLGPLILPVAQQNRLGREERRGCDRLRLEQCRVRQARQARLDAVDDVEAAERECGREVGAHADRECDALGQRRRHGRTDRHDVSELAALKCAPSLLEVGCARGRGDHGHAVAAGAQGRCGAPDVLVDVVRLRPGERRDEADAKAHVGRV